MTKKAIATYSKADPPKKGDLCFAKVRGFVPWPAYVTEIESGSVWVKFFNSAQKYYDLKFKIINIKMFQHYYLIFRRGKCSYKDIFNLCDGVTFLEKHKHKNDFVKAVKEMSFTLQENNRNKSILSCHTFQVYKRFLEQ